MSEINGTPGRLEVWYGNGVVALYLVPHGETKRESHRLVKLPREHAAFLRAAATGPELLEALEELMPDGWGDDDTMDHMPGVKKARLALAKARSK